MFNTVLSTELTQPVRISLPFSQFSLIFFWPPMHRHPTTKIHCGWVQGLNECRASVFYGFCLTDILVYPEYPFFFFMVVFLLCLRSLNNKCRLELFFWKTVLRGGVWIWLFPSCPCLIGHEQFGVGWVGFFKGI